MMWLSMRINKLKNMNMTWAQTEQCVMDRKQGEQKSIII